MQKKFFIIIFLLANIFANAQTEKEWTQMYSSSLKSFLKNGYSSTLLVNTTVNSELSKLDASSLERLSTKAGLINDSAWRSFFNDVEAKTKFAKEELLLRRKDFMLHFLAPDSIPSPEIPLSTKQSAYFFDAGFTTLTTISSLIFSDDHSKAIIQINVWHKEGRIGEGYCVFLKQAKDNVGKQLEKP